MKVVLTRPFFGPDNVLYGADIQTGESAEFEMPDEWVNALPSSASIISEAVKARTLVPATKAKDEAIKALSVQKQ